MKNSSKVLSSKICSEDLLYWLFSFFIQNIKIYFFLFGIVFLIILRGSSTGEIFVHNFCVLSISFFCTHSVLSICNILYFFLTEYRENLKYYNDTEEDKEEIKIDIYTMLLSIIILSTVILAMDCFANYFSLTHFKSY